MIVFVASSRAKPVFRRSEDLRLHTAVQREILGLPVKNTSRRDDALEDT
jgi:hypothetical protein